MNTKKPNEFARDLFNNCLYFTGGKMMARECALFITQKFLDYCTRMDDKVFHIEVQAELYKIDITNQ